VRLPTVFIHLRREPSSRELGGGLPPYRSVRDSGEGRPRFDQNILGDLY